MDSSPALEQQRTASEEALLLGRLAAGDRDEPLAELYRLYGHRIYGLGLRLLGDRDLAEELVQETFLRLWRSCGRFEPERGTVRTLIFYAGQACRHRPASAQVSPFRSGDPRRRPRDASGRRRLRRARPVARRPRRPREPVSQAPRGARAALFGDMTQARIAARLGVPLGTVKTRTFRAGRSLVELTAAVDPASTRC